MHPTRQRALNSIKNYTKKKAPQENVQLTEIFGSKTFNRQEMLNRLPTSVVQELDEVSKGHGVNKKLSGELANQVANAVKEWAISQGATHFTHWFQPMTGSTAEKHDCFLHVKGDGTTVEKFTGSQLIQSEPDASSFPSGGMRTTFEARGYTAWDTSSPIFIVDDGGVKTMCIPSVFVSYTGHSLDTKTGLMKSIEAVNKTATAMLAEMGEDTKGVITTAGCEQEYFLVDENYVLVRPDLLLTGRTLIGADPIHGQQLDDHYFGTIPTRAKAFMADVEYELFRLGVPAKTRHNEVAPAQFELAPVFEEANLAADHQMITMEVLQRTAIKHGFRCLMHEKPFAGINGSGKHVNWAMSTMEGENLLDPGKTPHSNFRFLAFLACALDGVYNHQVALRASIASHGNDHRLGANEAPPAIISAFLGSTLTGILEKIEAGEDLSKVAAETAYIDFGLRGLPDLPKDNTDRNRTSPFAFTGNKFEFRAVGSSHSVAFPVTMVSAAVAESMAEFTARLKEKKADAASVDSAVLEVVKEFSERSKAIRFEGDGYSDDWKAEAKGKGLTELLTTPEALNAFSQKEHHQFLIDQGIYTEAEMGARISVRLEQYSKNIDIEANTLKTLVYQYVVPAAQQAQKQTADTLVNLKTAGISDSIAVAQKKHLEDLTIAIDNILTNTAAMDDAHAKALAIADEQGQATAMATSVLATFDSIREACDRAESMIADDLWSLPKYREMLFIR